MAVEEEADCLLKQARDFVALNGETFWDMFTAETQTEAAKFYWSLPENKRTILRLAATAEALLAA